MASLMPNPLKLAAQVFPELGRGTVHMSVSISMGAMKNILLTLSIYIWLPNVEFAAVAATASAAALQSTQAG